MSAEKTHTITLRDGKAAAEHVTAAELKALQDNLYGFADAYDVSEHAPKPPKPAPAPTAAPETAQAVPVAEAAPEPAVRKAK